MRKQVVDLLMEEQNGRCAICFDLLDTPHLDHSHVTNEVRGLLCNKCNLGLGSFRDDPAVIARAIEYLTGLVIDLPDPR